MSDTEILNWIDAHPQVSYRRSTLRINGQDQANWSARMTVRTPDGAVYDEGLGSAPLFRECVESAAVSRYLK